MALPFTVTGNQASHKDTNGAQPGRRLFGLLGPRAADVTAPNRRTAAGEHDFPNPTADTLIFPPVQHATNRPGDVRDDAHHSPDTDPTVVAHNMLAVLADCLRHNWSATRLSDALRVHHAELDKRSGYELLAAEKAQTRGERNAEGAQALGRGLAGAVEAGVLDLDDEAATKAAVERIGRTIAARAVHAHEPAAETGLIPVIRDDAPRPAEAELTETGRTPGLVTYTVTANGSPVHTDGTAPPVPDEDPGDRSLANLPHRVPGATIRDAEATQVMPAVDDAQGGEPR